MLNNLRYVLVTGLLLLTVEQLQAQFGPCGDPETYPCCCEDCSCSLCGDIMGCYVLEVTPFAEDPSSFCGNGETTWWENNTSGVGGAIRSNPGDPGDVPENCIPIDGGLGFLIAGGLGIGVIGIRRRKEELEVERD